MKNISLLARYFVLLAVLASAQTIWAQTAVRPIPRNARRASLQVVGDGVVTLNGKTFPLSPAAQIRDTNNLLLLTQSMQGTYNVRVQLDSSGAVYRVWVLTPEEAARK